MALEVNGLVAGYTREVPILNGIDMKAEDGLVTVILGPNGAGKSTLLRTIYGYLRPMRGRITHDGIELGRLQPKDMLQQGIAYLIQGHSIFPRMTVEENLELGAWIFRRDRERVSEAFEAVYTAYPRLAEKRDEPAGVLSGGEQRMLEIARLTMTRPKTLLLDEPSVGLMPTLVESVYEQIVRLKEQGYTLVIVDQNVKKSVEIADYVYILELGENTRQGPKAEFAERLEDIIREWL